MHPTGELIEWERGYDQEPTRIAADELLKAAKWTAAACLFARYWPRIGGRHDGGLCLGGFLARCGLSITEIKLFAEAVAVAAAADVHHTVRCGEDSANNHAAGRAVYGLKNTVECFGETVAKRCADWLGYRADARPLGEAGAAARSPAADLDGERWTELGNAHRLIERYGENIRYIHPLKAWFIWAGHNWRRDDDGQIMRLAEDTIEAMFDEAKSIADETLRQAFRKFAMKSQTRGQLEAMCHLAQHQPDVVLPPYALDTDPLLLGVLNGTIELATGTFREGRREDYVIKRCAVAFDKNAQCPNWLAFQQRSRTAIATSLPTTGACSACC